MFRPVCSRRPSVWNGGFWESPFGRSRPIAAVSAFRKQPPTSRRKADMRVIGNRDPLQRSENAESSYFRHSPKRSTRDSDSANRRSHIADPWPPIEVSAALTRQRLEPEWVTSAILPSPTQARTSWTAACAPALTDGCRPNTNACQDLYRSSHPRSSGSTHPWYS